MTAVTLNDDLLRCVWGMSAFAKLPTPTDVEPIAGGRNNQAYRVVYPEGQALLKRYYHSDADPRDRLGAEYGFVSFLQSMGIDRAPRPVARNFVERLGLYTWLPGRDMLPADVDADAVEQAAAFFRAINEHRDCDAARKLPDASEACFTLGEHMTCVGSRLRRLQQIEPTDDVDREAQRFVDEQLKPRFSAAVLALKRSADSADIAMDEPLPDGARCLSPSDFGFHNARLGDDGVIRFFDFEYAGWDDPAKTVCDFLCQPRVPAPDDLHPLARQRLLADRNDAELQHQRVELLLPLYRIKWCCMMLNEFLPTDADRRSFADSETRKAGQLAAARRLIDALD